MHFWPVAMTERRRNGVGPRPTTTGRRNANCRCRRKCGVEAFCVSFDLRCVSTRKRRFPRCQVIRDAGRSHDVWMNQRNVPELRSGAFAGLGPPAFELRMSSITVRPRLQRRQTGSRRHSIKCWLRNTFRVQLDIAYGFGAVLPSRCLFRWARAPRLSQAVAFLMCHHWQSHSNIR